MLRFSSRQILVFLILMTVIVRSGFTDSASVELGFAGWQHEPGGNINWQGTNADLESGFKLDNQTEAFVWFRIEHPIPGVPNISLTHTRLKTDGSGTVTSAFNFGGTSFNVTDAIDSSLDLEQTDLTFFWNLVDTKKNIFSLGLTAKYINGNAQATNLTTATTESVDFSAVIPMVYGRIQITLPITHVYMGAEGNAISYSGHKLTDARAFLGYRLASNVKVEVGYRRIALELDNLDGVSSDLSFSGVYGGLAIKF